MAGTEVAEVFEALNTGVVPISHAFLMSSDEVFLYRRYRLRRFGIETLQAQTRSTQGWWAAHDVWGMHG